MAPSAASRMRLRVLSAWVDRRRLSYERLVRSRGIFMSRIVPLNTFIVKRLRQATEAQLSQAEQQAEHIKQAVRHRKDTATVLGTLEAAETKIHRLRAEPEV